MQKISPLALLLALAAPLDAQQSGHVLDREPPTMELKLPSRVPSPGSFALVVDARDRSGVDRVLVRYRTSPGSGFQMQALSQSEPGRWSTELPVPVDCRQVALYVVAFDKLGNGPAIAGTAEDPLVVSCEAAAFGGGTLGTWGLLAAGMALVALLFGVWLRRADTEPAAPRPRTRAAVSPTAIKPISERHSSATGPQPASRAASGVHAAAASSGVGPRLARVTPDRSASSTGGFPAVKPISERRSSAVVPRQPVSVGAGNGSNLKP
jgi:hypothetical protein